MSHLARTALEACLPLLESMAEPQPVYGFFHGGDPRKFSPDSDATEQERENHRLACEAYEKTGEGSPSCCEHRDGIIFTSAPFGCPMLTNDAKFLAGLKIKPCVIEEPVRAEDVAALGEHDRAASLCWRDRWQEKHERANDWRMAAWCFAVVWLIGIAYEVWR